MNWISSYGLRMAAYGLLIAPACALADWQFADVTPSWASGGTLAGVHGDQQVGSLGGNFGFTHAYMRNHSTGVWTSLHPKGSHDSWLTATSGKNQVGGHGRYAMNMRRAGLWSETPASLINLHPEGASESVALAVDGDFQGGYAIFGGTRTAGFWTGSASSWVSLHPDGADDSEVKAIYGRTAVGFAHIGGRFIPYAWDLITQEATDLRPAGFTAGRANAIYEDQFGGILISPTQGGAAVWRTGEFTLLGGNEVYGISENYQVGDVGPGEFNRAYVWTGTAGSGVQLPSGSGYVEASRALAVYENPDSVVIVGSLYNGVNGRAAVWVVPEPATVLTVLSGLPLLLLRRRRRSRT